MRKWYTTILICIYSFGFSQDAPTPEMVRQMITEDIKSLNTIPEKVFRIDDKIIGTIPVRIYYPSADAKLKVIYNIHGGALVAGDLETHENISRKIANAANAIVISVDYRKAPENPFPKSLDDVVAIYEWIVEKQMEISGQSSAISIVSDSGGALLAAGLQIQIKRKHLKGKISKAIYINPAFDLRTPGKDFYGLVTQWYLSGSDPNNELVSPIVTKDFSIFAPSLIVVNEKDILSSQGIHFCKKLTAAKVKNELVTIPGEDHFGGFWAGAHEKINLAFEKSIKFLSEK